MKLELHKKYKTRDGKIVAIVEYNSLSSYPYKGDNDETYIMNGKVYNSGDNIRDLVEEITSQSSCSSDSSKEPTPKEGTFAWAVEQMKQGKKVTRKDFQPKQYYEINGDSIISAYGHPLDSVTNIIATDWEIYEEEVENEQPKKTLWDKRGGYQGDSLRTVDVKEAFALYRKRMGYHMNNVEMVDDEQVIAEDCFGKELLE